MENEYLNDLFNVGTKKSLGYLPIKTLLEICNTNIEEILKYAQDNNLESLQLEYPEECSIYSGALFLYHESMLKDILHKNKDILRNAGIPWNSPIEYIKFISKNTVFEKQYPEAYKVIGVTFNDKRFRQGD